MYLLAGLALTILVMACINFTTLAIGRSAWRTKEVGVRKVIGAQRSQLVGQFWSEALLMSALAALLGLGLARLCLPLFNAFTDKALTVAGRTKEIGIRKVLGASAHHILLLIARDFGLLVGVGFLLAAVPAFLLLRRFLSQYAFHVGLGPGAFLTAALLLGLLAFGTVGVLVLRAARRDPVESLRYE